MEQQSLKLRIGLVVVESSESERLEDGAIISALDAIGSHLRWLKPATRARFVVEDGGIKLFFGGEMAKDHRLGDTCRLGDFLGRCSPETSFRKEAYSHPKNLKPALLAGHSGAAGHALNCNLLAQDCFFNPSHPPK